MTNPDSSIGTNGAYGGRTSVNAFNDNLAIYTSRGIVSGWACAPSSGMTVALGGTSGVRDVAIAEDPNGNRTTINNISGQPVQVAISAAPATNSRIDSIVAYVENPPAGSSTEVDNPAACGIIAVSGTTAASPSAPSDATIRSAITADGGTGSTAYYVVLANVTVANGTTDITSDNIKSGEYAGIGSNNIDWGTFSGNYSIGEQDTGYTWITGDRIYKKTFVVSLPNSGNTVEVSHGITNLKAYIKAEGVAVFSNGVTTRFLPCTYVENNTISVDYTFALYGGSTAADSFALTFGNAYHGGKAYVTVYYCKNGN